MRKGVGREFRKHAGEFVKERVGEFAIECGADFACAEVGAGLGCFTGPFAPIAAPALGVAGAGAMHLINRQRRKNRSLGR